jgi:predicted nucleotidyltransferase
MDGSTTAAIGRRLQELEALHDIVVLYACESGSRCWGFESRDSDWDVRFIYKHPRERYLALDEPKQQLEWMAESEGGKLDIVGWDVKKALLLARKSNPAMLEWVRSPIIYSAREPFASELRRLTLASFSVVASAFHYASLARSVAPKVLEREQVVLKRYFYLLRPLLALQWISMDRGIPPVEFAELLDGSLAASSPVRRAVERLLVAKRSGDELSSGPRVPELHEFLERGMREIQGWLERARSFDVLHARMSSSEIDEFFRSVVDS